MKSIIERVRREPALVYTLVGAVLVLLVQAGVPVSDGLANAISALVVAVMALVVRSKVSPIDT